MKKDVKFWLLILFVAIVMIILSVFVIYKFQIHKAKKEAENIVIGDNENIVETDMNNINDVKINEADVIGKLTIPDILLKNAPIKEGTELSILSEAIGHFKSTSIYSGNVGLASHNSGGKGDYFKNLKNMVQKDMWLKQKILLKKLTFHIYKIRKIIE